MQPLMTPIHKYDIERKTERGVLSIVHLCDLHFGVIDPKIEFDILKEQVLQEIINMPIIDIIVIDGDLFDRKFMSNTDSIMYASIFLSEIRNIAIMKNATVIVIEGTKEHDAGQLKLFYHYLEDPEFDIRIVENIKFEYVKGARVLCIPELYGIDESIYRKFLFESGFYDLCFMHGTIQGAVPKDEVGQSRLFHIEDFLNCNGLILSGHVHTPGCFNQHFYYGGSPIRWRFGEEAEKGFLLVLYDLDQRKHYTHMIPVVSFRYDTIDIDEIMTQDPKKVIEYINELKEKENIDYLRIKFTERFPSDNLEIVKKYYQSNGRIKLKLERSKNTTISENMVDDEIVTKYSYIFDTNLSPYNIFARYVNDNENSQIVSAEMIESLLNEKL